jgi:hypothetical protein
MWMSAPPLFLFAKPQASIKQKMPILSTGDDARNLFDRSTPLICPTGKSANSCPAPFEKIFLFCSDPNHLYIHHCLVPLEGRIAIVTDAGRDVVDAASAIDEQR